MKPPALSASPLEILQERSRWHRQLIVLMVLSICSLTYGCRDCKREREQDRQWGIACEALQIEKVEGEKWTYAEVSLILPPEFQLVEPQPRFVEGGLFLAEGSRQVGILRGRWEEATFREMEGSWKLCVTAVGFTEAILMERLDVPGTEMLLWPLVRRTSLEPLFHLRSDLKQDRDLFLKILASVEIIQDSSANDLQSQQKMTLR